MTQSEINTHVRNPLECENIKTLKKQYAELKVEKVFASVRGYSLYVSYVNKPNKKGYIYLPPFHGLNVKENLFVSFAVEDKEKQLGVVCIKNRLYPASYSLV